MSNVIDFPPDRRAQTTSVTRDRAASAERASALRRVLNFNRSMTATDQIIVAEGVWRLLDRLKRQGIKKAQVLQEARLAKQGDSTKWLGQYAVSPDRLKAGKGLSRLNKRPRQYVALIKAAAKLAGSDPDEALLEVFGATSLAAPGKVRATVPAFEELAQCLRDIAEAVAVKHKLQAYFQELVRSGNKLVVANQAEETDWKKLAPEDIALRFCGNRIDLDWPIAFHGRTSDALFHDHAQSLPPYPAVLLGEWSIPGDGTNVFRWDTTDDPHHRKDGQCSFGGELLCRYKVELRLCIVPVGPDLHPSAALRVKVGISFPTIRIEDENGTSQFLKFEGLDWIPSKESGQICARVSSNKYLMNCRLWRDEHIVPPLIDRYFPLDRSNQRFACQFLPLTGAVIEDWFDFPAYDFDIQSWHYSQVPIHIRALGAPLFLRIDADDFADFQANTVAAGLEHCISGRCGANPLDLLDTRAGQIVGLFRAASASARARRNAAMTQLSARLQQMRGEKPSSC